MFVNSNLIQLKNVDINFHYQLALDFHCVTANENVFVLQNKG